MNDWHSDVVYTEELLRLHGPSVLEGLSVFGYALVRLSSYCVGGHWHQ